MLVTITFTDDRYYLVPGALAWLKECEQIINDHFMQRKDELFETAKARTA